MYYRSARITYPRCCRSIFIARAALSHFGNLALTASSVSTCLEKALHFSIFPLLLGHNLQLHTVLASIKFPSKPSGYFHWTYVTSFNSTFTICCCSVLVFSPQWFYTDHIGGAIFFLFLVSFQLNHHSQDELSGLYSFDFVAFCTCKLSALRVSFHISVVRKKYERFNSLNGEKQDDMK